jgi:hypothetical protein
MSSSKSNNICQFADKCPIFQGLEKPQNATLLVHRNVFCNRGQRGWKNCDRFLAYEKEMTLQ